MKSVGEVLKLCPEKDFGVLFIGFGKSDNLCVIKEMGLELGFHIFNKVFSLEFEWGNQFLVAGDEEIKLKSFSFAEWDKHLSG